MGTGSETPSPGGTAEGGGASTPCDGGSCSSCPGTVSSGSGFSASPSPKAEKRLDVVIILVTLGRGCRRMLFL